MPTDDTTWLQLRNDGIRVMVVRFVADAAKTPTIEWVAFLYEDGDERKQDKFIVDLGGWPDDPGPPAPDPRDESNREKYGELVERVVLAKHQIIADAHEAVGYALVWTELRRTVLQGRKLHWVSFVYR